MIGKAEGRNIERALTEPTATPEPGAYAGHDSDVGAKEDSTSLFTTEEKLSILYWAGAAAIVLLAVATHPGVLALLVPLLCDVYRQARTGRSTGVRLLEAATFYQRAAARDRRAAGRPAPDMLSAARDAARRAASGASALVGRMTAASGAAGRSSAEPAESTAPATKHEDAGAVTTGDQGYEPGGGQVAVAQALRQAPADLVEIVRSTRHSIAAHGRVPVVYGVATATIGVLALTAHPLFAVFLPALAVDYALWRWQGISAVAELASARIADMPTPPSSATQDGSQADSAASQSATAGEYVWSRAA